MCKSGEKERKCGEREIEIGGGEKNVRERESMKERKNR